LKAYVFREVAIEIATTFKEVLPCFFIGKIDQSFH